MADDEREPLVAALVARPGARTPMSKGVQIALATLSVFAGIAWLVSRQGAGEGTFAYYSSVSEYVGAGDGSRAARATRVHGFVVEGSIAKDLEAGHVEFAIRDKSGDGSGETLAVRLLSLDVPDLFRDGAEVVVEGEPDGGLFLARRVLAKCPSKYEAAPRSEA
jgi:cytochrome c-type biogenesis protein CcmE